MPFLEPRCQSLSSTFIAAQHELGHLNEKAAKSMGGSAKKRQHSYSHTARRHNNKFPSRVTTGTWVIMAFGRSKDLLAMETAAIDSLALSAERNAQQAISDATLDVCKKDLAINRARALRLVRRQAKLSFEAFVEARFAKVREFVEAEQPRETSRGHGSEDHWTAEAHADGPLQYEVEESVWAYESDDELPQASQTL